MGPEMTANGGKRKDARNRRKLKFKPDIREVRDKRSPEVDAVGPGFRPINEN